MRILLFFVPLLFGHVPGTWDAFGVVFQLGQ